LFHVCLINEGHLENHVHTSTTTTKKIHCSEHLQLTCARATVGNLVMSNWTHLYFVNPCMKVNRDRHTNVQSQGRVATHYRWREKI